MDLIELKHEDKHLVFCQGDAEIYDIPISNLADIRKVEEYLCSDWVLQLSDYSWSNLDLLYRLAKTIQDSCPENNINWHETFFIIEQQDYLDSYGALKSEITQEKLSAADELREKIKIGREDISESVEVIKKIVGDKLLAYAIA